MSQLEKLQKQKVEIENKIKNLEKIGGRPVRQDSINWKPVLELAESYVHDLDEEGYVDDDMEHYIKEAVLEAVFGEDVWKWINSLNE